MRCGSGPQAEARDRGPGWAVCVHAEFEESGGGAGGITLPVDSERLPEACEGVFFFFFLESGREAAEVVVGGGAALGSVVRSCPAPADVGQRGQQFLRGGGERAQQRRRGGRGVLAGLPRGEKGSQLGPGPLGGLSAGTEGPWGLQIVWADLGELGPGRAEAESASIT